MMLKLYFTLDGESSAEIIPPETGETGYHFRAIGPRGPLVVQFSIGIQDKKGIDWMEEYIYKHARYDPNELENGESFKPPGWFEELIKRGESTQRQGIRKELEERGLGQGWWLEHNNISEESLPVEDSSEMIEEVEPEEEIPSVEEAISMIEEIENPPEEKKSPKVFFRRKPKREPGASEIIGIK